MVERELECYNIDSNYWNCAGIFRGQWSVVSGQWSVVRGTG
ncbi:hypothetical protein VAEKB19_5100012 [Vibrio aestuarianus]|nr:hypothetical protein VAEKB19_5100012 [Vibrio aestuarianus]